MTPRRRKVEHLGPWFRRRQWSAFNLALLIAVSVWLVGFLLPGNRAALSMIFVLPTALMAVTFGTKGGIGAGLAAIVLLATWGLAGGGAALRRMASGDRDADPRYRSRRSGRRSSRSKSSESAKPTRPDADLSSPPSGAGKRSRSTTDWSRTRPPPNGRSRRETRCERSRSLKRPSKAANGWSPHSLTTTRTSEGSPTHRAEHRFNNGRRPPGRGDKVGPSLGRCLFRPRTIEARLLAA